MTCDECERQLLELSGEPQGELREHLAGCADCRAFRSVVATLESGCGGAAAPSPALDAAVLRLGREELRGVRRRRLMRLLTRGVAAAAVSPWISIWLGGGAPLQPDRRRWCRSAATRKWCGGGGGGRHQQ